MGFFILLSEFNKCTHLLGTNIDNNDMLFGIPINTLKVVLIPLLIFVLGIIVAWIKKKLELLNRIKSSRSIIMSWISLIEKPISLQSESIIKFIDDLKSMKIIHPVGISFYLLLADKLNEFKLPDLSIYLVESIKGNKQKNSEHLFNIVSMSEFLKSIEIRLQNTYEVYKNEIINLMNKWNELLKMLDRITFNERDDIDTDGELYKFQINLKNEMINDFPNTFNELKIMKERLLTPLLEHIRPLDNKHATELVFIINDMLQIEKQYEKHKEGYSFVFMEMNNQILISYDKMKEVLKELKNQKIKPFWRV